MPFRLGAAAGNNVRAKSTDAITGAINFGTTNTTGRLLIYQGTQPVDPQTAPGASTLLVTINFANPAFASADSTGTAGLAGGAISATVSTSGTAQWFRVTDRNNNAVFDGSIGTSGQDMNFDNVNFVQGGTATVNTMTIQTPM